MHSPCNRDPLDWLVVGGGIHGVHLAARLLGEGGVKPDRLRILDPAEALLDRWRTCTATTGMSHLRSPSVHHLDLEAVSLRRFAGKKRSRKRGTFAPPYDRPSLELFNAHCDLVVETFGLRALHVRDRAHRCTVDCESVTVQLSDHRHLSARNVVLAVGSSERPHWPEWAPRGHSRVHHVFQPGFDGWPADEAERIAVVGGGISAVQVALRLVREQHEVHLISRHDLREHQFDSDPGWLGPRHMNGFLLERDPDARRAMITEARHRGSVPPDLRRALRRAVHEERLVWHRTRIEQLDPAGPRLRLAASPPLTVDRVLLATGFEKGRPGGRLIDDLVASAALPCASCGYPIVDTALRWHPRIHVSGPLAELELGPAARNIAGARRAGDRLIAAVTA